VFERFYSRLMLTYRKMTPKKMSFFTWAQEVGWRRFCRDNGLPVEHSAREFLHLFVAGYLSRKAALPVRSIFGTRMRMLISGGAALNYTVAKFFCGMGLPLMQGYGLTESSPVISMSCPGNNHPLTVGEPVDDTQVRLGEMDELQVRGPQVMRGYWERPDETAKAFTEDGWLRTGDQADLSDGGRVRIKGRIKEIIVTSVGEKVSPVDLEFAIKEDHLFEQIMVIGENRPFITALVVPNQERWHALCADLELDPDDPTTMGSRDVRTTVLKRIRAASKNFPRYGQPRNVAIVPESWTVENGLLTTTRKLRRRQICERYAAEIEELYSGHGA
jgi:long-chain acyl-CoA synthetase